MACKIENMHRRIVIETLPSLVAPARWPCSGEEYCLVVIADLEQVPSDIQQLGNFAASAIRSGARLIICYGSAAELIHDVFDEVIAMRNVSDNLSLKPEDDVMTVSLGEAPLSDALQEIIEVYRLPNQAEKVNPPIVFVMVHADPRIAKISALMKSRNMRPNAGEG